MAAEPTDTPPRAITPRWVLGLLCLLPAIQTAVAVYWEIYPAWTYPLLKGAMVLAPIAAWRMDRLSTSQVARSIGLKRTLGIRGVVMGSLTAAVILGGYYTLLRGVLDGQGIHDKVASLGLMDHYLAMALVISLWNALFEEYYWRGFLFSEMSLRFRSPWAPVIVGGMLFGLHHIFALAPLFPWPLTIAFTVGTMAAGVVWLLMRSRGASLIDCYISHVMADLAIMWIGWDLIQTAA